MYARPEDLIHVDYLLIRVLDCFSLKIVCPAIYVLPMEFAFGMPGGYT